MPMKKYCFIFLTFFTATASNASAKTHVSTHKHKKYCGQLGKWKPTICKELTDQDREQILLMADPNNFQQARFVSPPHSLKPIEEEVDCSHFTNEIYRRIGITYPFVTTKTQECLSNFKSIPKKKAKPGDLILFKSHMGILSTNGKIISSGRGGKHHYSKLSPDNDKFIPSVRELKIHNFGTAKKYLRWTCE